MLTAITTVHYQIPKHQSGSVSTYHSILDRCTINTVGTMQTLDSYKVKFIVHKLLGF